MEFKGAENDEKEFKSPNLNAERRRRRKLSERLLTLRSLVPIITNMNKATIIEDAITYIQELQKTSNHLTNELLELNSDPHKQEPEPAALPDAVDSDPHNYQIKEEVDVRSIGGGKVLIKMVFKREPGLFTKLVQGMSSLGLDTTEICATTFKGAMLVSASLHQEEVDVRSIGGGKVLIKMVFKREPGLFTKLVQGMSSLGLDTTEICATTFKGAMLVSASLHQEEVDVRSIGGGKVLIKMVFKREPGLFTKLVQGMSSLGLDTTEICATTFKGAMLVSASLHQGSGTCDHTLPVQLQQTREFLSGIVNYRPGRIATTTCDSHINIVLS